MEYRECASLLSGRVDPVHNRLGFTEKLQISLVFLWNIVTKNEELEPLLTTPSTFLANYHREMKCISQEWTRSQDQEIPLFVTLM